MNEASRWRLDLGRRIGVAYARNPNVRVVMVAGSTGRGTADRFSDLELDVYWTAPPTEKERREAAEGSGGKLVGLDEDADEWEETISFGGFQAHTSAFLVRTMERYLADVLDRHSTEAEPQMRLHSLLHAQTLVGEKLVERWRARASVYPPPLGRAMVQENLTFEGFGYAEEMLTARGDLIVLYDRLCRVERRILGALLGLNGIYLPNPGFKRMDETIGEMTLVPVDLSARLKSAFHLPPTRAVIILHGLVDDVFALVETHMPDIDTAPYRQKGRQRRGAWDAAPETAGLDGDH